MQYTIKFTPPLIDNDEVEDGATDDDDILVAAGSTDIIVKLAEFDVPSNIADSSVTIQVRNQSRPAGSVSVDGTEIRVSLPTGDDKFAPENNPNVADDGTDFIDEQGNFLEGIGEITVIIRANAGIKNPTEGKIYSFDDDNKRFVEVEGGARHYLADFEVVRIIELDPEDGGRGDTVELKASGFKNGTTVTFYRHDGDADTIGANRETLCSAQVNSADIGSCEITVTAPLFERGDNFINAVDGRSKTAQESGAFVLEPAIEIVPAEGSPGESIQVQMYDFRSGSGVSKVEIARQALYSHATEPNKLFMSPAAAAAEGYSLWTPGGSTSGTGGEHNFRLVIPNQAPGGVQDFRVTAGSGANEEDASTSIFIGGPSVMVTPTTVLANQRISLVGNGFNPGSTITSITFGGDTIDPAEINDSDDVNVDSNGNWSASVDLPLATSTVAPGSHSIKVSDSGGRTGEISVTVPARSVTITPETGRVGTLALVSGKNFPSKNDDGQSFSIEVVYEALNGSTTTTAVPNASGAFETEIRIPTTATIPSTNVIKVSFNVGTDTPVVTTLTHNVPEGVIDLSETSGSPGTTITISGEGFKAYVPVSIVKVGAIEVTPAPRPSTDVNGMMSFDITIPGLDNGIQTVEVRVGQTTASTGFTVQPSGVNPGDIKAVAEGLEELGDNLEVVWHFNNDSKAWTFYDGQDGSNLTHLITGETYLIQVKSTVQVILNRDTRNLTCVDGNCWNQIVW
ncbi:MAG: hypothetical protein OXI91_06490 [Chloroflexota bacterium]|nr:hypothetical protein [Chloroflexota bacterium]